VLAVSLGQVLLAGFAAQLAVGLAVDARGPAIVDRPIDFGERRKELTVEYRRIHQDPKASGVQITPRAIVLHYTAGGSVTGTWRYFNKIEMEGGRAQLARAGRVNVSSHFLVDRDGTIYRLMPETWMARHCIGLNHIAIGVENVGDAKRWPLTAAQVDANAALVRFLARRHPITHLIGHHEARSLEGTPLWLERDPNYRNRKSDPGAAFMMKVRAKVADLELGGVTE
jgi:N-acetylmuramoyl-L-alanine amidase